MLWMSMTFRVWFEYGDLGCHGRSLLVGRHVCIDGFQSFGHDLNHEVISKILIGIRVVISCSKLGRFVIKEGDSLSDPRFPTIFHCHTRCLISCWCRDVGRWIRCCGVGPIRKGRSEGRPSGYTFVWCTEECGKPVPFGFRNSKSLIPWTRSTRPV